MDKETIKNMNIDSENDKVVLFLSNENDFHFSNEKFSFCKVIFTHSREIISLINELKINDLNVVDLYGSELVKEVKGIKKLFTTNPNIDIDSRVIYMVPDRSELSLDPYKSTAYTLADKDNIEEVVDIINNELSLDVYYEDNHVIVVNKEAGILSQEDKSKDKDILSMTKSYIKFKYKKAGNVYLGLISRLDRNVSGLMVLSKSTKATERLNNNRPEKRYIALVYGLTKEEDTITLNLSKDEKSLKAYIDNKNGKVATTSYKRLSYNDKYSLIEVKIDNGRFHQIRFTMSYLGHPIYNDFKYDNTIKVDGYRLGLDAYKVEFIHPVSKELIKLERFPNMRIFRSIYK
ncbi:MAG: RluA family pseudouridine synthase [Gammaproteobacteria bacterium]|nr:RluA family pseudouridine synthase [Gammaproteobacteria bacterium]